MVAVNGVQQTTAEALTMTNGNVRGHRDNDYNDNGKGRGEIVLYGWPGGGIRDGFLCTKSQKLLEICYVTSLL